MIGTKDSQSFTEKLMAQVQAMNAPGAHTGGITLTEGGAPAVSYTHLTLPTTPYV